MEIFFIIVLMLVIVVVSAIIVGKNKAKSVRYEKELAKETKNNPNKNIALTIIATGVAIIAFIMVSKEYQKYQQEQEILKILYGTTDMDKIEKINKKIEQDMKTNIKKMDEEMNKANNSIMKQNQKIIEEANRINQRFRRDMEKINQSKTK